MTVEANSECHTPTRENDHAKSRTIRTLRQRRSVGRSVRCATRPSGSVPASSSSLPPAPTPMRQPPIYEELSKLSNAELERRGIPRGELHRAHLRDFDQAMIDRAGRRAVVRARPLRRNGAMRLKEAGDARIGSNVARLRRLQRPAHHFLRTADRPRRQGQQRCFGDLVPDLAAVDRRHVLPPRLRGDQSQRLWLASCSSIYGAVLRRRDRSDHRLQATGATADDASRPTPESAPSMLGYRTQGA